MKNIVFLQFFFAILLIIHDIHGVKVTGPRTSFAKIMERIFEMRPGGSLPNMLPDPRFNDNIDERWPGWTAMVGRRLLKEKMAALREKIPHGNAIMADNDDRKFISNDFSDYDEDPAFVKKDTDKDASFSRLLKRLNEVGIHMLSSIDRRARLKSAACTSKKKGVAKIANEQNDRRIKEIVEFLEAHPKTTQYVHNEVKRIIKQGRIRNDLRIMVDYLEQPGMETLKESVLNCFKERRGIDKRQVDIWKKQVPNNLVINTVKDPYNFGFVN